MPESHPLTFPAIDPVLLHIGPLAIRWYALAYVAGILLGWLYVRALARRSDAAGAFALLAKEAVDDMVVYAILGIMLGGRLGYVLFYKPLYFLEHPLEILQLWHGGMSFHGGMLGFIAAFALYSRRYRISFWPVMDLMACATPIGLFFGRIANFINGELYGRPSDVPWAMIFPGSDGVPRHPSQLYEAGLEGIALFFLLFVLVRLFRASARPGLLSGMFLLGYSTARTVAELFREPDAHLGFIAGHITMGQLLSAPMWLLGAFLVARAYRRPHIAPTHP